MKTIGRFFSRTDSLFLIFACFCQVAFSGRSVAQVENQTLRAGASLSNITPFLDELIVGNFTKPAAKFVHDELYAKSLVLDDGNQQLAIVIIDNIMASAEMCNHAKSLIEKHTGIKKENVLIAATHTHSSVSASGEDFSYFAANRELDAYQKFLANRISDGVRRAIYAMEPAKIGFGSVPVPQHVFNRRWHMKEGTQLINPFGEQDKVKMNPGVGNSQLDKPAGPTDPDVSFISVQALDGRPLALLANYSLHYVGGVPAGEISADYFGVFAKYFSERVGGDKEVPGFMVMMSNGTSGDINNIDFRGPAEKRESYEKMGVVARDVADAIFDKYPKLDYQTNVRLGSSVRNVDLAVRKPSDKQMERAKYVLSNPKDLKLHHPLEPHYARAALLQQQDWPDRIAVVLQAMTIGDVAITAIPFEVFAETGLDLKQKSPFKNTFNISLANGSYIYLPTPRQHALGGYETWLSTSKVEAEASVKITNSLLEQLTSLKGKRP
jgi:neutral ceramidase